MKKYLLISLMILSLAALLNSTSYAQKKLVNKAFNWAQQGVQLDTALKALDVAATNEETKNWAKTYYTYALVYQAIANTQVPEFQNLTELPLIKAFDNYKKTYYMEGGKSFQTNIDIALTTLYGTLYNKGVESYNAENFVDAFKYFEKSVETNQMPVFGGSIDTALIFNTAIMAQRNNDWDNAIKYYEMAKQYNYMGGDLYAYIAENYKSKGDTTTYLNTLKAGFEKYPENQVLISYIINYYLLEKEDIEEAFRYLDLALEKDPTNAGFYSAKGHLYDKTGNKQEAINQYNKAIEINPEFFEAYYNLGVIYFNEGVALTDKANEIKDNKKYEEAKAIADKKFEESLPFIEKAFELHPEDKGIGGTLKNLYYRLKKEDPILNKKYEDLVKKLDE